MNESLYLYKQLFWTVYKTKDKFHWMVHLSTTWGLIHWRGLSILRFCKWVAKLASYLNIYKRHSINNKNIIFFVFIWLIVFDLFRFEWKSTSYLVFTTVIGMSKAPDIARAVEPKTIARIGERGSSHCKECFSQCRDEKYKPTPGTTLMIDCEQNYRFLDNSKV